LLLIAGN